MDIKITKDTEDIREGRNKTLKKGTVITVTKELGNRYISAKKAKELEPDIVPVVKDIKELEKYESQN